MLPSTARSNRTEGIPGNGWFEAFPITSQDPASEGLTFVTIPSTTEEATSARQTSVPGEMPTGTVASSSPWSVRISTLPNVA